MTKTITVKIQQLHLDAEIPKKQTEFSVGYDLHAYTKDREIIVKKGNVELIPTGLSFEIPKGYDIEIRPRSGLSTKFKVIIPNSPGTIDSDYRGEIFIPLLNLGDNDFIVTHGMRIGQAILRESFSISWENVNLLDESTNRGKGGFGSTGI